MSPPASEFLAIARFARAASVGVPAADSCCGDFAACCLELLACCF